MSTFILLETADAMLKEDDDILLTEATDSTPGQIGSINGLSMGT